MKNRFLLSTFVSGPVMCSTIESITVSAGKTPGIRNIHGLKVPISIIVSAAVHRENKGKVEECRARGQGEGLRQMDW